MARRRRGVGIESLEPRRLLAVSATMDKGVLRISMNADGDLAVLTTYPTTYAVQGTGLGPTSFARSAVTSIKVSDVAGGSKASHVAQSLQIGTSGGAAVGHALSVDGIESTLLNANISTAAAGGVTFAGPVLLPNGGAVSIGLAPSSTLAFAGTINGSARLTIDAPAGAVSLSGAIGKVTPLAALAFTRAGVVSGPATIAVNGGGKSVSGISFGRDVRGVSLTAAGSTVTGCTGAGIGIAASVSNSGWSRALSGFTVTKCGVGIDFAYSFGQTASQAGFHGWTMSGNTVSANATHGVRLGADAGGLSSTSSLVISGNQVSKNTNDGIRVEGTPEGLTIQGNTVVDNGRGVRDAAIRLADGRGVQRKSILVKDNVVGGADATTLSAATGITATNMPGLRLVGNKVTSVSRGIRLTGNFKRSDTAAVLSANVVDNVNNGISLATASAVTADVGNAVTRARKAGLEASGLCTGSVLKGLSIVSTESATADGRTGVLLDGAAGLQLEDATVKGGYFGVYAKGHATNTKLSKLSLQQSQVGMFLDGIAPSSGNTYGVKGLLVYGNTTIVDATSTGLHAQGDCAGTRVFGQTIRDCHHGVHLVGATGITVSIPVFKCAIGIRAEKACTGSGIQDCSVSGCDTAVSLESATGLLFKNQSFTSNVIGVNASGVSAGTRLEACEFKNSESWGISLVNATGIKFIGGSVTDNAVMGLSAQGASSGTEITGMTFSGNGNGAAVPTKANSGIVLSATKGLTVNGGTTSEGNRVHGLHAEGDCTGTTVSGCMFSKNGGSGVSLIGAQGLSISGATVTGNTGNGFTVVADAASTTIAGCTVSGNISNGVVLSSATGLAVNAGNKLESNGGNGLYATGVCTGTTFTANTVSSNAYGGVVLVDARSLSVTKNTIGQNKSFGLYATGAATGTTVTGNTISGNNPNVFVTAVGGTFQKA